MFDSIGWGEIFVVVIVGLIIIGPERLPGVIEDVRAAIFAARRAINNAKAELNGEFEGMDELRAPINTVTEYAAMGPKRAIAKVLFDEEGEYLDQFDPRRMMEEADAELAQQAQQPQQAQANQAPETPQPEGPEQPESSETAQPDQSQSEQPQPAEAAPEAAPAEPERPRPRRRRQQPGVRKKEPPQSSGGGFSWADVT